MAPKFVINGIRNSKNFISDLTSKEYAARFKIKRRNKVMKMMEKADSKRNIKVNGLVEKLGKKEKKKPSLAPVAKV